MAGSRHLCNVMLILRVLRSHDALTLGAEFQLKTMSGRAWGNHRVDSSQHQEMQVGVHVQTDTFWPTFGELGKSMPSI